MDSKLNGISPVTSSTSLPSWYPLTMQYETLNDAAAAGVHSHILKKGSTEIWYANMGQIVEFEDNFDSTVTLQTLSYAVYRGWRPKSNELKRTHVLIGSIFHQNLEDIFRVMQGECWSPKGEATMMIRKCGADHTSMSVGDVIKIRHQLWICCPTGFEQIRFNLFGISGKDGD